jgi:hypothetical protein
MRLVCNNRPAVLVLGLSLMILVSTLVMESLQTLVFAVLVGLVLLLVRLVLSLHLVALVGLVLWLHLALHVTPCHDNLSTHPVAENTLLGK